ncbi:hypothetical protein MKW92_020354 [Papaver armeniacum]|nr:hypothetical protein MKW92_020354 [Papaver armeniacum]
MAKNALIFSPFFFGLLFVVLIAFISEQGGGVRGQYSCSPGTGVSFGGQVFYSGSCYSLCQGYCTSLAIPVGFTAPNSGVKSGQCHQIYSGPGTSPPKLCLCCVA